MTVERTMRKTRRSQSAAAAQPLPARAVALQALRRWRNGFQFADAIIQSALPQSELSAPDRAFAQELFYGVLRNLTLLDFWIGCLRRGKIEAGLRDILRLGLYQLFLLEAAEHAAVFETVELAREPQRAFINALLRSALRQKQELTERAKTESIALQFSHPQFLLERWAKHFGDEAVQELCLWNNRPAPLYARINLLRTSVPEFLHAQDTGFVLPDHDNFVGVRNIPVESIARGECYMQDPSTSLACRLLNPERGERILDACAAPGGKTAYLAELMQNRGAIVACDRSVRRLEFLRSNLKRLGVTNAEVQQHDWLRGGRQTPQFDRILIDVPCTNTGVMRRRIDVRWRVRPDDFARMPEQQLAIARSVIPSLKAGGVLVYSTCSLERDENEEVIEQLRREFPQLELQTMQSVLPFRDAFDGAFAARFRCSGGL